MTPLLEQFLLEAREFVEETSKGLLELELHPGDGELLDSLFRRIHTLKGNAGLFGFGPLIELSHAAEDVLDELREGALKASAELIDVLLRATDVASMMLDSIEQTGAVEAQSESEGREVAHCLRLGWLSAKQVSPQGGRPAEDASPSDWEWIQRLPAEERQRAALAAKPLLAIQYIPEPECFSKGEDPLFTVRHTPGLISLSVRQKVPLPALDMMDVFQANLIFELLSDAPASELQEHFRYVLDQVAISSVPSAVLAPPLGDAQDSTADMKSSEWHLTATAAEIIAAQETLLNLPAGPEMRAGRIVSVARTLEALLRGSGRTTDLANLSSAIQQTREQSSAEPLRRFLAGIEIVPSAPPPAGDSRLESSAKAIESPLGELSPSNLAGRPVGPEMPDSPAPHGPVISLLKVPIAKVDRLLELAGEMVVAKNSLPYVAARAEREFGCPELAREIKSQYAIFHRIVQEMQDGIQQVRMLPVGTVFQRFPRLVRDLNKALGKDVDLLIEGEGAEVDKQIVEALADPLVHILRNSLDHGIETPAERLQAGKPPRGRISIQARQDGDRVHIQIDDDGRGIDPEAVKRKAYEKNLISEQQLESLDDAAAIQLVFLPGFSTAETVTDVSGRGVGMDVVRRSLERVGGTVTLSSKKGSGTSIRLALPLSMAVSRVLEIRVGGQSFGVPLDEVLETVRVPLHQVHSIGKQRALVLRGEVIPLYSAAALLEIEREAPDGSDEILVMVARCSSSTIGLIVDGFSQALEVIVKPMEGPLAHLAGYGGTALLGDGSVLPVLSLKELL